MSGMLHVFLFFIFALTPPLVIFRGSVSAVWDRPCAVSSMLMFHTITFCRYSPEFVIRFFIVVVMAIALSLLRKHMLICPTSLDTILALRLAKGKILNYYVNCE
ncbi:hypothetical protein BJL93_03365 [Bifidobacterium bifidum]|nr:hypothetical protein BBL520_08400 [Bifidobacterium breve]KYJ84147.1 hypothetical protein APS66_08075 [Bifidobacterium bifidum]OIN62623.1 hypothetical protein BFS25_07460 [Bifidobacterium longum subsp. infantis]OSP26641.1 hypothetical protein BJL93_03365 [Bifidobacterium bifidum]PAK16999.1 hypothetical protein CJO32_09410 [Bifidobacterium longum]